MIQRCQPLSKAEDLCNRGFVAVVFMLPLAGTIWSVVMTVRGDIALGHWLLMFGGFVLTQIGAGLGYHRLFSHRSFQPKRSLWLFLAWMGTFAFEGPVIWWAGCHRLHHQHTDVEGDIHSPLAKAYTGRGKISAFVYGYYGWLADWSREAIQTIKFLKNPDQTLGLDHFRKVCADLLDDAHLRFLTKYYAEIASLGLVLNGFLGLLIEPTAMGFVKGYVVGGLVRLFLQHHSFAFVNTICHLVGERRFAIHDASRNVHWLSLWTFGESLHNNHHAHPWSVSNRTRWFDLDVNYFVLRGFAVFGLVDHYREFKQDRSSNLS